ncbi:HD-GYP domain-containing protein [Cytobacillus gottheilii]|uniref:HD-GYP domain-containing protein n=1 Tax=Cytobacillus gottheilii TaxID=859144 RepID=UPI0009B99008|nr:HD-GYP domain-containing protein [Cytobacillus gottheilii]
MGKINEDSFIETVHMKGLQISLIASGDGTEVIYHKMQPGTRWGLEPAEGWSALEYIHLLSGKLSYKKANSVLILQTGDVFYRSPVDQHYVFESEGITEFIYITSQPVFHHYSLISKELEELAISIEEKDGYTVDHCTRISRFSMKLGELLELNTKEMFRLSLASFFHDIGKVKVPLNILQKPGKLTSEEWELMKKHTTFGREILEETGLPTLVDVGKIVEQHHERYDGQGYPFGLKDNDISIQAAIISVVDSFDAMTTDRVYRGRMTKEEAIEELIRCRGTMYNPYIVDIFIKNKELFI